MLNNLHIKSYALIDELSLEFAPGLNIFTGETGAGKSIVIDALGLALGERADASALRAGAAQGSVTACFDAPPPGEGAALDAAGISVEDGEPLILRREIDNSGRSRAFINDRPVTLQTLAAVSAGLVDVHGQHEHQSLFSPAAQRDLLDGFAGTAERVRAVTKAFSALSALRDQLNARSLSEQERARLIDLYSFQRDEIDAAALTPDEEERIAAEFPRMKNAERLRALAEQARAALYADEGSACEHAGTALRSLDAIRQLCPDLPQARDLLAGALEAMDDCARQIESFAEGLAFDPAAFERLLERRALIEALKKKYGSTVADILAFRARVAAELSGLENAERDRADLDARIAAAETELKGLCAGLTESRKKAAKKLARLAQEQLAGLGMPKAVLSVAIEALPEPQSHGADRVEFLFSANAGEPPRALRAVASGGELSRVMLALKTVLAEADRVPVLVFDEIDAGVGGPTGGAVGLRLRDLAGRRQVLCVTHLPQIAACAQRHFKVDKAEKAGRTATRVSPLSSEGSLGEIARMLSGAKPSPTALTHARELVAAAKHA